MDELLTDLKLYDNHKASRHEAKAGGRLQGEVEAERSRKLFWAGDVQAEVGSRGSAYRGKGRSSRGEMWRGACSHQRAGSPPCPGPVVGGGGG